MIVRSHGECQEMVAAAAHVHLGAAIPDPVARQRAMMHDAGLLNVTAAVRRKEAAGAGPRPKQRPLRVALLQTQAEGAGAQEISRILGAGLRTRGFEIHPIFFFRRTAAFDRENNVFFCAPQRPTGVLTLARLVLALIRRLREIEPDVVLCFQHYGIVVGTLAARLSGTRAIIASRTSAKSLIPSWVRALELAFGLMGLQRSVVVNSRAVESEYQFHPRRYRDRLLRIEHGFEPKTTGLTIGEARASFGLPAGVTLLGSVARLHHAKNLAAAIRLLAGRTWHLAIAGQGPAHGELSALAASLGVANRVHFVGELPQASIGGFLRALDVFVFPSRAETFGLAVVEAAQAGVPVVANDLPVLRETLAVDGEPCALFANTEDPRAFAAAVERVLDDRDLAAVLSSRGARLQGRYPVEPMVQRYADLIETTALEARTAAVDDRTAALDPTT